MKRFIKIIRENRVALVVLIAVPLALVVWRLVVLRPTAVDKASAALGSVGNFLVTPIPNHGGTHVAFTQSTEKGVGMFLADTATGKRVLLGESEDQVYTAARLRPLGWSPDDKWFAYLQRTYVLDDTGKSRGNTDIYLVDGVSGAREAAVRMKRDVTTLTWLTEDSFAFDYEANDVILVRRVSPGKWSRPRTFRKPAAAATATPAVAGTKEKPPAIEWLVAASANSVAYQQDGALWWWRFDEDAPKPLFESSSNQLVNVAALPNGRKVLLHYTNSSGSFVSTFNLGSGQFSQPERIGTEADTVLKVLPINGGEGLAWLVSDRGQYSVLMKSKMTAEPTYLLARGSVERLCASDTAVYVVGSLTNEPPGIWEFDPRSGSGRLVVPNPEQPFEGARNARLQTGNITNRAGEVLTYHLLSPPGISPGKKYPVVLTQSSYGWRGYQNAVANAGAYWMNVDRPSFHDARRSLWQEDVMSAHEWLGSHPNMDTSRVYLCGASAEVWYANSLLASQPELWKGVILFHPGGFPDLNRVKINKAYFDAGELDQRSVEACTKFQEAALKAGIQATFLIHPNSGHTFSSREAHRRRSEALAQFIIKD